MVESDAGRAVPPFLRIPPGRHDHAVPLSRALPLPSIRPFPPQRDYASLSMHDLLDAREAYHVYLSTLENVVATAIGRYLIHKDDWYAKNPPDKPRPPDYPKAKMPRTLENSVVRPWSWPCVLVFVRGKIEGRHGRERGAAFPVFAGRSRRAQPASCWRHRTNRCRRPCPDRRKSAG